MKSATRQGGRNFVSSYPTFLTYWVVRLLAGLSYQMFTVVVGWRIYDETGSVLALGGIGLTQFLPAVLLVLPAGHVVDRFDRRMVLVVCQLAIGLCMVSLATGGALVSGSGYAMGALVAFCLIGTFKAFEFPAMQAILPTLVPVSEHGRAAAIAASASEIAIVAGPVAGGLLYSLGSTVAGGVAAFLYFLAGASTLMLKRTAPSLASESPSLQGLLGGFRFLRHSRLVWNVLSLDLIAILFGSVTSLLPVYAHEILLAGPVGLGCLRAAPALGAAATLCWLSYRPIEGDRYRIFCVSVFCYGIAVALFAVSSWLWLSLVFLAFVGAFEAVTVVIRTSLIQFDTPDQIRGRVGAVNSVFINAAAQLGQFESGLLASWAGARAAAALGGLIASIAAFLWERRGR